MRPCVLGNPLPMGRDEAQRDPVCAAHAAALHHAMSGSAPDLYAIGSECGAIAAPLPWDPWGAAQRVHELRRMARNPRGEGVQLRRVRAPANCHRRTLQAWIVAPGP